MARMVKQHAEVPELKFSKIPKVARRPRRELGPVPDPDKPVELAPALEGLLTLRHTARMERAEWRSLHPEYLNRIRTQLETERAVEQNLARGRALVRRDIRRATDPARFGLGVRDVNFPRVACVLCEIIRPVIAGGAVLIAPFLLFFALALVIG